MHALLGNIDYGCLSFVKKRIESGNFSEPQISAGLSWFSP